ncbi:MAG TPA: potassium-transporting ATPase subunit KdpC [Phenylobacterium sp.]|jgi:K+-transporting ATPase ATPase C chain|uniref:potassium-transporting ATPase subunit KdpC n=1 Tax=Phenylobacterium sp. TaxID=1871053 RepID=UPI002CF73AD5|nr:potassium-transporting ATPase subunit KdpC [Phenylobacterium sp.]HXA40971.1 potassium-transporting ATPase subunit KdpC [Phenylobacterium sp.]
MLSEIRPAIVSTVLFTALLGLVYPLAITGVAKVAFPYQAEGSLVRDAHGQVIGSALIAQPFAKDEYLHPRPSAAGANGYDPTSSGGSNYGPLNPDLAKRITTDAAALRASTGHDEIPDDAITTSGSGLDPDISPAYAFLQADRIAKARGVPAEEVRKVIAAHVGSPVLGFLGQPHVNVLMTNRALDAVAPKSTPKTS